MCVGANIHEAAEMWADGLFVLMLSLNTYQLCFLLFMVNQGTWAKIGLKDLVVAGNL
jgi:hypothetical protein